MRRQDVIRSTTPDRAEAGAEISGDAPPQRQPTELPFSEDLGGVVNPHDADLIDAGGWSSWSGAERLAVVAAVALVAALVAVVLLATVF